MSRRDPRVSAPPRPAVRAIRASEAPPPEPSYRWAAAAALSVLTLYIVTLAPTTAMWDASEYIAAAYVLGVPHPPGNPFFILIGRVFSVLPIAPGAGMRINVLAAFSSAIAAGMWFLIAERVLAGLMPSRWQRIVGALAATCIAATAFTVWNQSVVNEKVYTVSLAFFAIVSWLTVRWCDDPDAPGADRLLVLVAFLLGLGYANHPAGFLVGPAVAVAVIARRAATLVRWRLLLACAAALLLGLTPFAIQPIRAAHFPALNMGEATGCTERIEVGCTFSKTTWERLEANITREQYGKPSLLERQAPFTAQIGMWWLYFEWQWLRDAYGEHRTLQNVLALLFLGLGLAGGWVHWRYDRRSFWFFGPLVLTVTVALVFYMNFKYGWSQAPALGDSVPREVRDRDYFYLWSFSAWSVWVGLGLAFVWSAAAGAVARVRGAPRANEPSSESLPASRRAGWRPWLIAAPVLLVAFIPFVGNREQASRAGETATRDWAHDLLNSVEPYGILITGGDNDTFPLWYAQEVEGIRRDVTVAVTSLLNTDWYVRQLIRRPVYEYDAERGPALYRDREWKKPDHPVMRLSIEEADSIPPYLVLDGPRRFRHGGIDAELDPRRLPYGALERADIVVLQMLRDNLGERPLYFARSAGNYGDRLGLEPWMITHGLARKVMPSMPEAPGRDTVLVRYEGWVDVARTRALWEDVYQAPESLIAQDGWVDRASVGIPAAYTSVGLLLAQLLEHQGDDEAGRRAIERALAVAESARVRDWFVQPEAPSPADTDRDARQGVVAPPR